MKLAIVLVFVAVTMSGCKATVETEVNITDLLNSESKTIDGDLYVEVAACNSYEDSREPSSSLVEAQQNIPSIFEDAGYVECFSKEFDSFAHFSIPFALDKDKDGHLVSDSYINIISNSETLLTVGIPDAIKRNMERVKENSFGMSSFDLEVNVKIQNDTGESFPFKAIASYIDGQPYVFGELISNADGYFIVTLSDVSVSSALDNGTAMVLMH